MEERIKNLCAEVTQPLDVLRRIADDPSMTAAVVYAIDKIATYAVGVADALRAIAESSEERKKDD